MTTAQQAARANADRRRATCPECGKVLRIASEGSPAAGRFPGHRRPAGGNCPGAYTRVRIADIVHPCKRCQVLPVAPDYLETEPGADTAGAYRPPTPRPVKARGYCATHLRDVIAAERERNRDNYRAKTYGLTPAQFRELIAAQGGACACGLTHSRSRSTNGSQAKDAAVLAVDHNHARQAECVAAGRHGPETCCEHCVRGALGRRCNREIVGRFTADQLRNLAAYMDNPTAQRIGWWDQ